MDTEKKLVPRQAPLVYYPEELINNISHLPQQQNGKIMNKRGTVKGKNGKGGYRIELKNEKK